MSAGFLRGFENGIETANGMFELIALFVNVFHSTGAAEIGDESIDTRTGEFGSGMLIEHEGKGGEAHLASAGQHFHFPPDTQSFSFEHAPETAIDKTAGRKV